MQGQEHHGQEPAVDAAQNFAREIHPLYYRSSQTRLATPERRFPPSLHHIQHHPPTFPSHDLTTSRFHAYHQPFMRSDIDQKRESPRRPRVSF
ncbi:hypothetical protein VTJ04DRAFT_7604 [Mycothermus thermophilus]|uniref:uncharacterized protein n=1 Tax=Humicola insolens TaxID=85995 RepID=UPI0037426A73